MAPTETTQASGTQELMDSTTELMLSSDKNPSAPTFNSLHLPHPTIQINTDQPPNTPMYQFHTYDVMIQVTSTPFEPLPASHTFYLLLLNFISLSVGTLPESLVILEIGYKKNN